MTHKRQYGARCGRSRPPSRSDGGDPAASSDRCGRSRFRRAQRDRCDPAAIPNTEHAEAAHGKSLKNALKRFLAALRWHFILLYGLMGLCLTSPLTLAFSFSFAPVPESAERVAPHLPFYIARKGPMTLYLLVTLHVGNASDYPRPERFRPAIRAALKASPALAFELSPDDLILSQDDVQRYGMCAYPCLRRLAPAALWRRLAQRLRDHPAEFAEIKKARPWLAAMLLDTLTALAAGLQTEYGTEAQLENIYTAGRILGLETVDEQILAFARLTSAEQLEMLRQSRCKRLSAAPPIYVNYISCGAPETQTRWRCGKPEPLRNWRMRGASLKRLIKTTILMAAITALFMSVGHLLGGQQGMMIALLFALAMNFFSYWFSDKLVLRMYRAQEVDDSIAPQLYRIVHDLAMRARLPMPRVYLIDESAPNAFATGRNPHHAAVAATTGLMRMLTDRELRGVMAHELAHIQHRDILISTICATMAGAISALANFAMFFGGRGRDEQERSGHPFAGIMVAILAPLAAALIQMAISRAREFEADRGGAEICADPQALATALDKIHRGAMNIPFDTAQSHPETAQMMIMNPLSGN